MKVFSNFFAALWAEIVTWLVSVALVCAGLLAFYFYLTLYPYWMTVGVVVVVVNVIFNLGRDVKIYDDPKLTVIPKVFMWLLTIATIACLVVMWFSFPSSPIGIVAFVLAMIGLAVDVVDPLIFKSEVIVHKFVEEDDIEIENEYFVSIRRNRISDKAAWWIETFRIAGSVALMAYTVDVWLTYVLAVR